VEKSPCDRREGASRRSTPSSQTTKSAGSGRPLDGERTLSVRPCAFFLLTKIPGPHDLVTDQGDNAENEDAGDPTNG
jgi:hypothetical protein